MVVKERGILIRRHLESDGEGLCGVCMIYDEAQINEIVPISVNRKKIYMKKEVGKNFIALQLH